MKNKLVIFFSVVLIFFISSGFAQEIATSSKNQQIGTVDFFYYGPGADEDVMSAILGEKPLNNRSAILHGYRLGIQSVNDIPDAKVEGLRKTARKIIKKEWGDDFTMYVAHKGDAEIIKGVVWTIKIEDLNRLKHWELVEYGWYSIVDGDATFADGKKGKVLTIVVKNQTVQKDVDGLDYDLFLGKGQKLKDAMIEKAGK
jgi:hypothetical protein